MQKRIAVVWTRSVSVLLLVVCCVWAGAAAGSCKWQLLEAASSVESERQYWKESGLTLKALRTIVDNAKCYQDRVHFLMCIGIVKGLLKFSPRRLVLAPKTRQEFFAVFGQTVESFGEVEIVESKPLHVVAPSVIPAAMRKIERAMVDAWLRIFELGKIDFEALVQKIQTSYIAPEQEALLAATAINTALVQVDAHARIQTEASFERMQCGVSEEIVGAGVVICRGRNEHFVKDVLPGSPAAIDGLKPMDRILRVDGVAVELLSDKILNDKISGFAGSRVQLDIRRAGVEMSFNIIQQQLRIDDVTVRMLALRDSVYAYIRLASFMDPKTPAELARAIKLAKSQRARAIVLDLRGNPGGLLDVAVDIVGKFTGPGKVAIVKTSVTSGGQNKRFITSGRRLTDLPLVILVDASSASASELLSGALQEGGRAVIVGERTFGKGSVQARTPLSALSKEFDGMPIFLWRTVARFSFASGRSNQLVGIEPDLAVGITPGADPSDTKALREQDLFPNALSAGVARPRPMQFARRNRWLKDCIERTGKSVQFYLRQEASDLPHDYRMLYALDAAKCLSQYQALIGASY